MQFLSPAQLVLVLWLLAAAAPAATVLMNGSMLPLAFCGTEEIAQRPTSARMNEMEPSGAQRATVLAEIWTQFACADAAENADSAVISDGQVARPASVSSLLHTGVQRHRPKAV